jgi:hypothetical protein
MGWRPLNSLAAVGPFVFMKRIERLAAAHGLCGYYAAQVALRKSLR